MRYKVTNKTSSPIRFLEVGILSAGKSIVLFNITESMWRLQKEGFLSITEIEEM